MMSLQECRAAVLAIREVCDLPVMVSLTYNEDGRTLYGTDPVTAVVVMQSLGADAVGMNCSTGPEAMLEPIAKMAEYAAIPLLAKPNAGMPELIDGQTVFNVEPEEFAEVGKNWSKRVSHHWRMLWNNTGAHPCFKGGSKRYPGQSTASDEEKNADFRA